MAIVKLTDAAELTGVKYTDEGYMVGVVKCARVGVQEYHASELGIMGDGVIPVTRLESEVFSEDSRKTYSHAPVTIGHPDEQVTSENWDQLAVGEVSTDVKFEGGWVHVPIIVKAKDAIDRIKDGLREISMGYTCNVVQNDGEFRQTNIKINHLAFVDKARAGSQSRIGDNGHNWGASPITRKGPNMDFKTVVLGDKAVKIAVDDAPDVTAFMAAITADHKSEIETKDAAIGELKAKLAGAEKAKMTDAEIDARVTERAALIADAKTAVPDIAVDGKSDSEIRKAVVASLFGDDAVAGASDAEVSGMFKAAKLKPAVNDGVRNALKTGDVHVDDAWGKFLKKGDK